MLGEEGPVSHLACSGDAVYDFSTGLIYRNGRYYDPGNGIWLTGSGVVVFFGAGRPWKKNRKQRRSEKKFAGLDRLTWILLLLMLILLLAGCQQGEGVTSTVTPEAAPSPTKTPCPDETRMPTEAPTATGTSTATATSTTTSTPTPANTATSTSTNTPTPEPSATPTVTQTPTYTPTPLPNATWTSFPVRTNDNYPDWIQWYGFTVYADESYSYSRTSGGISAGCYGLRL